MQRKSNHEPELDKAMVTIEFLRARLVSERSLCKSARERSLQLEEKIYQLEHLLEGEVSKRKKAEQATKELLYTLQYPATPADRQEVLSDGETGCFCRLPMIFSLPRSNKHVSTAITNNVSSTSSQYEDCNNVITGIEEEHKGVHNSPRSLVPESMDLMRNESFMSRKKHHDLVTKLWVASSDSEAKLTNPPQTRPGKSCRTFRTRSDISHP